MITLRPYQDAAIDAIMAYWQSGGGNPLVEMATGTGKSMVIAKLTRDLLEAYPGFRVLMLTHVKELVAQNFTALLKVWPDAPAGIYSAGLGRRDVHHRITFASIQSVYNKAKAIGKRDLVLIDECFVAGTPIRTPFGSSPIESLRPGNLVSNATGVGIVQACRRSFSSSVLKVELSNGTTIRCTDNHPFFTGDGWIAAGKLEIGRRLFCFQDVRELRRGFQTLGEGRSIRWDHLGHEAKRMGKTTILLNLLLEAERECDVRSCGTDKDVAYAEANWSQTDHSRRQRDWVDKAAGSDAANLGCRMGSRACRSDADSQRERLPNLLQDRHSQPHLDDWHRVGGEYTQGKAIGRGFEEGCTVEVVRVVAVSRDERPGGQHVFNLQVSGHPSYFAHEVLVHNCHLVPLKGEGMYCRLLDDLYATSADARVAGFTATPYRLDTGRLDEGATRLFDKIVYSYGIANGIQDDYLSPLISKASAVEIDVSKVDRRGGEFVPASLEHASDAITAEAVSEISRFGADRRSWLIFCAGVKHAAHVRDAIRATGISCDMVTGDTPGPERDSIIRRFKAGEIRALTNANVLTTGFDAPAVDLVAMLRPTLSTSLYVQIVGRGTRKAYGKENCLILDFAGNVRRHGPVDAVSVMPKTGGGSDGKVAVDDVRAKECPDCKELVALNAFECKFCGHQWPREEKPKHEAQAESQVGILSTEKVPPTMLPVVDWRFDRHEKFGSPDSVRVSYIAGLADYREWLAFEHGGYATQKAQQWWTAHGGATPFPKSTDEALARRGELTMPATISVKPRAGTKFIDIVSRSFGKRLEAAE